MKALFADARRHWQTTIAEFAGTGVPPQEMAIRRTALQARTLADVRALVSLLP
jgi:hypothetical protein